MLLHLLRDADLVEERSMLKLASLLWSRQLKEVFGFCLIDGSIGLNTCNSCFGVQELRCLCWL